MNLREGLFLLLHYYVLFSVMDMKDQNVLLGIKHFKENTVWSAYIQTCSKADKPTTHIIAFLFVECMHFFELPAKIYIFEVKYVSRPK